MTWAETVTAFVALFVVIDPVGTTPIFVALTRGMAPRRRRAVALRAVLVAAGILLIFAAMGESVLAFFGISMPAFRIAGGMLLFLTALEMLFERRGKRREEKVPEHEADASADPSVFPLALPLIAGPGAIATVILLADGGGWAGAAWASGVMLAVLLLCLLLFSLAGPIERLLGTTGINVFTRVLGMLLAALSVQFVVDGVRGLAATW
jgi:multiple antibiotic resistance protein